MSIVKTYPKTKRIEDPELLRAYRASHPFCEICAIRPSMKTPHHIRARSIGGDDVEDNVISLCNLCHARAHQEVEFARKVRGMKDGSYSSPDQ
jgi:hypothetical protein